MGGILGYFGRSRVTGVRGRYRLFRGRTFISVGVLELVFRVFRSRGKLGTLFDFFEFEVYSSKR